VRPNLIVASIYDGSAAAWALEFHLGMMRKSFRFVRHHIEHSRFSPLGMLRFRMTPTFWPGVYSHIFAMIAEAAASRAGRP
jgi:hypothetical protein